MCNKNYLKRSNPISLPKIVNALYNNAWFVYVEGKIGLTID